MNLSTSSTRRAVPDGRLPYLLIVQQDRDDLEFMRQTLAVTCQVKVASDGLQVLSLVLERKPDLVILDLVLPGIPGLEVIHALQSTGQDIPIIATVGGDRRSEDWLRASIMGAAKLLRKPIGAEALVKWVRSVLAGDVDVGRTPEADDAAALLLDHGRPKIVDEHEFRILIERASRMNHTYDQSSTILVMQMRSVALRDCVKSIASDGLRSGDFVLPYRSERLAVLLPLTDRARVPSILERIGKSVEREGFEMRMVRCGAVDVDVALSITNWNALFMDLVPWHDRHEIASS